MTPFRSSAALLIAAGTFAGAQPSHTATAILESTIKTLAPLHTVRYTVRTVPSPQIRGFTKGQTVITGAVGGEKVRISAKAS